MCYLEKTLHSFHRNENNTVDQSSKGTSQEELRQTEGTEGEIGQRRRKEMNSPVLLIVDRWNLNLFADRIAGERESRNGHRSWREEKRREER